jgi:Cu+-exporting ATPase
VKKTEIKGILREIPEGQRKEDKCHHCGGEFDQGIVEYNEHYFCCTGCRTVFQLLNEGGLEKYYSIEERPGNTVGRFHKDKYAYLENEEIRDGLIDFSDGGVTRVQFYVPGIHCSSCIWLLENLNRLHSGIHQSTVNFVKKTVDVVYKEDDLNLREVVELLAYIGYEPSVSLRDYNKKDRPHTNRSLYYKLGIAGFSFGNIMLLSFPEYLDELSYLSSDFKILFGGLNFLLALPVFLYSSSEYFQSAWKSLRKGYVNIDLPISLGIVALFFRSSYEIFTLTGSGFMDSFTMLVFLLLVGKWYQGRTYQALSFERDYRSYFPLAVNRIRGEKEEAVPVRDLRNGDVIALRNQEILPGDSILLSDSAVVDYSFVSGESTPISKTKGDKVFAGGRIVGELTRFEIQKEVSQSYLTKLWNQAAFQNENTRYESMVNSVSKYFTLFILSVAVLSFMFWYFETGTGVALNIFTSVLIIACPCALALTLPFSFGNTMTFFGKHRFYLKNAQVVESLFRADTVVFDKTGTLTFPGDAAVSFRGELEQEDLSAIRSITRHSTHPLSKIIADHLKQHNVVEISGFREYAGKGVGATVNGIWFKIGSGEFVGANPEVETEETSTVHVSRGDQYLGSFNIRKEYRKDIGNLISDLKSDGLEVHLISGDNAAELENMTRHFERSLIHFDQKPQDKLEYIEKLQSTGKNVVMIGDGLNDAGALKAADVGIAVSDDVYTFTPASDAILDGSELRNISRFIAFSKNVRAIVQLSFLISFLYNVVGLLFAVNGKVTPLFAAVLMPVSSITVVSFITIAIRFLASRKKFDFSP